jgi:tagatose 1,6-diphosphate aldolase GatY/KbaY
VVQAAEAEQAPVLLQLGAGVLARARLTPLVRMAQGLSEAATVPVGVHLDHARDVADVEACLRLGCTSVMFDGSSLPYVDNVRLTRGVVERAHAVGAWVEAELAGIPGDEETSSTVERIGGMTDPLTAADFVGRTGVDALAVAVGNVHGMSAAPAQLDFDLLGRIAQAVPVPLVLHGASGQPTAAIARAIRLGVVKLNVNAELRRAYLAGVAVSGSPVGDGLADMLARTIEATQRTAQRVLRRTLM